MENDSLFDILLALKHSEDATRLKAIHRLHRYVNSAEGEYLEEPCTEAERLHAWSRARVVRLQQKQIKEALLAAVEDNFGDVRFEAAYMLGDMEDIQAHEALIQHLKTDPYNKVRFICSSALRNSEFPESGAQAVISALQDPSDQIVAHACNNLASMACLDAVDPLRAVLAHPCWEVRYNACEALIRLHAVDQSVVDTLEQLNLESQASKHNETAQKVNEINAANQRFRTRRALTTEEALAEARRALPQ